MTETYMVLKRVIHTSLDPVGGQVVWRDLGEVGAGYPQAAVQKGADGPGEYLVISSYGGPERFTVTARTEYDVAKVEPEPTVPEPFVPAMEPPF